MRSSASQVELLLPHLASRLRHVFTVMDGFIAGCGVLVSFVGLYVIPQGLRGTGIALSFAGLLKVATMIWTNFALKSDFKWLRWVLALAWLVGLASYAVGARARHVVVAARQTNRDTPK